MEMEGISSYRFRCAIFFGCANYCWSSASEVKSKTSTENVCSDVNDRAVLKDCDVVLDTQGGNTRLLAVNFLDHGI
jgi:hypothetical protein